MKHFRLIGKCGNLWSTLDDISILSNGISGERQKYVYMVNISSGTGTVMSGNALLKTMGEFGF